MKNIAMLNVLFFIFISSAGLPVNFSVVNPGDSSMSDEEQIIAVERAVLDRWKTGDVFGFIEAAADEITYFDPGLEKRTTGIKEFSDHIAPANGTFSFPSYELLNPLVQLKGETGILTFNFVGHLSDGNNDYWNATEIYQKINNEWKLVSSHWSHTKPQ